ncbi:sugar phosphate isomerase/epimerase [Alteromonas aestuariivivens]|uniref:Sugar phosphate isomerase/epimerase n=1 Tax=Alteromonas aestuariivivens TaxID=1938339 RepID=A0A3D8M793_9ALTE|nr:sugar phosphate isomerase/epimerase [Alteromonas aestuariivivens]RDV25595.1 sugar phosphate isomerase/epimerase [Alteromonas aestuariivivens]
MPGTQQPYVAECNLTPVASPFERRQFLKLGATVLSAGMLPNFASFASATSSPQVGLQLYTLRDWMAASVPATLKMVSAVGYSEVEFAGYFDHSASEIRAILNGEGLRSPSAHFALDKMISDTSAILDAAQEVGHQYIVIPYLSKEQRGTHIDDYKKLAQQLNEIGEACKKAGIQLAYHNHDFEFERRQDQLPFDVLLDETEPGLVCMELDLYWTVKAGQDPMTYFNLHPGRFKLWHVKDMDANGEFADVGTGNINFEAIFAQAEKAGVEHFYVERDRTDNKLQTIQQGFLGVSQLLG